MKYHLGTLQLEPDFRDQLRELEAGGRRERGAALAAILRDYRFLARNFERLQREAVQAPDLLETLRDEPGPDGWVFELAEALGARRGLHLTHCERQTGDDGYLGLAVHAPGLAASVRAGDEVCAGLAALRGPDGAVQVLPRIYRKLCANGAVVFAHAGADLLRSGVTVTEAVDACLSPATAGAAFARLQAAARTRASDPIELLRLARVVARPEEVWAAREDRDGSVFGVVNALTAHARRERRLDRRLELERGAARILAGVHVGAPDGDDPAPVGSEALLSGPAR